MTDISGASQPRDRFNEASKDMMLHISDKLIDLTRNSDFKERLQTILDPLINHVINRVFPYIILSSILFVIMLLVTVSSFIILIRAGNTIKSSSIPSGLSVSDFPMINGVPEIW